MKAILILLITTLFYFSGYCQDPQLFEHTWYLKNLIIDGEDNLPPNNSEVQNVTLNMGLDFLWAEVCTSIGSDDLEFDPIESIFSASNFVQLPMDCNDYDNQIFQNLYFITFFEAQSSPRSFEYEIELVAMDNKRLTLINEEGNQAIYGNQPLSIQDFSGANFTLFPIPAKENIILSSINTCGKLIVKIFTTEGRQISFQDLENVNQASIDVSNLSSGIYFLNIEDESGNLSVKKFIKQ